VAAVRAVDVLGVVTFAAMIRRAPVRVLGIDLHHVLVDVVAVGAMEMAVVQVIDVIAVHDRRVPAVRRVLVGVFRMSGVLVHTDQSWGAGLEPSSG
jgi:hypothetical protein